MTSRESRDNQIITYVTDAEKRQLKEWAAKTGKSQSELAREAILEFTDHDRTRRLEEKVDRILNTLDAAADGQHTHTNSTSTSRSVPEKARAIADHLNQHHETPVKTDDVELAIENIADVGDDRSVRKYKSQLKKRNHLFEHPLQPVWTDSKQEWVNWMEGATVDADPHEVTDDYGVTPDEYADLAMETDQ